MTDAQIMPAVQAVLETQRARLDALHALLQSEQEALLRADAMSLPEIAERKTVLFGELQALETQRLALFAAQGPSSALDAAWQPVRTLAQAVAADNQRNGAMIAALIRNTEGALQVLRGAADAAAVYSAKGYSAAASGSSRPLASA